VNAAAGVVAITEQRGDGKERAGRAAVERIAPGVSSLVGRHELRTNALSVQADLGGIVVGEGSPRHDESPGNLVTCTVPERGCD
jgi:hypothetical protein